VNGQLTVVRSADGLCGQPCEGFLEVPRTLCEEGHNDAVFAVMSRGTAEVEAEVYGAGRVHFDLPRKFLPLALYCIQRRLTHLYVRMQLM
jgi:hypothetical protein